VNPLQKWRLPMLMRILAATLCLSGLGAPSLTYAATTTPVKPEACRVAPQSAACRFARGLLWKIERAGQKPSHLFGTIHLADARVTDLPAPVRSAFDPSERFAMELVIDGGSLIDMAEAMFLKDDRTLDGILGAERFAALKKLYAERGLPVADLKRKKPWAAMLQLSMNKSGGVALDFQLQLDATLQNKDVIGLESTEEQLAVFDGLNTADQVALLDSAMRQEDMTPAMTEAMVQAYLARDLTRILLIADSGRSANPQLYDTVMARLLTQRNQRMFERLGPSLSAGNTFIAVGAAHLPGERGLLALLERAGWRVTPVY
jgi:uncharacterized protein YbaP (TraB family)